MRWLTTDDGKAIGAFEQSDLCDLCVAGQLWLLC